MTRQAGGLDANAEVKRRSTECATHPRRTLGPGLTSQILPRK
jgi:hypothetical protein